MLSELVKVSVTLTDSITRIISETIVFNMQSHIFFTKKKKKFTERKKNILEKKLSQEKKDNHNNIFKKNSKEKDK